MLGRKLGSESQRGGAVSAWWSRHQEKRTRPAVLGRLRGPWGPQGGLGSWPGLLLGFILWVHTCFPLFHCLYLLPVYVPLIGSIIFKNFSPSVVKRRQYIKHTVFFFFFIHKGNIYLGMSLSHLRIWAQPAGSSQGQATKTVVTYWICKTFSPFQVQDTQCWNIPWLSQTKLLNKSKWHESTVSKADSFPVWFYSGSFYCSGLFPWF